MTMPSQAPPPPGRPAAFRPSARGRLAAFVLPLALLAGCGGGTDGDAQAPPPQAALPTLSGRVTNGVTPTAVGSLQITVKGNVGTARTAEGRLAPVDGSDYLASLDQLSGPYLLSDSAASSSHGLYAVATAPGTANLTPLTTLMTAQLLAQEPGAYFAAQGARGGFTAADDAALAAAQQRVRRLLQREYGFELPAALGDFVTSRFDRVPGDLMFDTLQALVARLGVAGDLGAVVTAVAQEAARCRVEQVALRTSTTDDPFCPFTRSNAADLDDATVRVLAFANRHGDTLTLRLRGSVVLGVRLLSAEGVASGCSDSGCTGIGVGTPAGDRTQLIGFAGTVLSGPGGPTTLDGSLRTAVPGIDLPGLPCTSNRYYLIHEAALTAEGYCATPDDFGLGGSGQSQPSGATRRVYTFGDGAGGPSIEVVVQGDSVLRALVYTTDPDTGAAIARYQCRDGGCSGITIGTPTVDQSLGVPVVLRTIRFARATLAAVLPDGSLSATDPVVVDAELRGLYVYDPAALPLLPLACGASAPAVSVAPSDQAQPIAVCEPDDSQGFQLRSTTLDADGNTVFGIANLLTDGAGGYVSGNSLSVALTPGGALAYVVFDLFNGPRFRCDSAACTGITVGAPDGAGERSVAFAGTTLREQGTAGLPADRTVSLGGGFVAPVGP